MQGVYVATEEHPPYIFPNHGPRLNQRVFSCFFDRHFQSPDANRAAAIFAALASDPWAPSYTVGKDIRCFCVWLLVVPSSMMALTTASCAVISGKMQKTYCWQQAAINGILSSDNICLNSSVTNVVFLSLQYQFKKLSVPLWFFAVMDITGSIP